MSRIQELEKLLSKASKAYYGDANSSLSDAEFDVLRDELEELDPNNPVLAQVGASVDSSLKVKHMIPMGSLKKMNKQSELDTWRNGMPKGKVAVELKLDGSSVELVYENGKFIQAITRGDGNEGEDITNTIQNARYLRKNISVKGRVSIRCECLLHIFDWEEFFSEMANPRNAAAGIARRSSGEGSEFLSLYAFDVLFDNNNFTTEQDRIDWLTDQKFVTTPCEIIDIDRVEEAIKRIEDQRDKLHIEIDGAVIKLNNIAEQEKLGEHNGRPYWARAWKFAPMGGHTIVEGVSWAVGTQGTINPVAKVAPVSVGGTTIQNVTLHNMDEIERLGIQIGDKVEVIRAGDVIPQILRVVAKGSNRTPITIDACPACGANVKRDGPKLFCSNDNCDGVANKKIKKWVKKRNIMFLGDSSLDLLIEEGLVKEIPDLYRLTVQSMSNAGLGTRMSEKIKDQLDKSRVCSLSDLVGSLSLDMLGRSEASNLVGHGIDTLDKWHDLTAKQIASFPGYQSTKATRISVAVKSSWPLIAAMAIQLTVSSMIKSKSGGELSHSFCFTGKMENKRGVLEQMAVDNGGQVRSVSKELDYLVIADPNSTSSKAVKARELGITLISENDFLEMVK